MGRAPARSRAVVESLAYVWDLVELGLSFASGFNSCFWDTVFATLLRTAVELEAAIDDLRKSRGLHSVNAYRHGLYIYIYIYIERERERERERGREREREREREIYR